MKFSYDMTIGELVALMNNGGSQNALYKASRQAGKAISKDLIPYLFKAAAYDYEKNMYQATSGTNEQATIDVLLPVAKQLQKRAKLEKLNKQLDVKPIVVDVAEPVIKSIQPTIESNSLPGEFSLSNPAEVQRFILTALDLTQDDLSFLKELSSKRESMNSSESIYESIKQLGGRERINKTYYISKEIIEKVAQFCDDKSVKVSQFVEIAILEAIKKYE